ncbi:hypothetical protein AAHA92_15457 [Salvia divinorum]|uniref:DUF4283 domain-containing protein n=1 Tax=Salvia divinorum TaxID=28513 RepID=A0ABD1HEU5_SALDI
MPKQVDEEGWTKSKGKQNKKRMEEEAVLLKLRAHLSDFMSNLWREGETSDLSDDEREVVPDTPLAEQIPPRPITWNHNFAWIRRTAYFETEPTYEKEDLVLHHITSLNPSTDILSLDINDHVPIHKNWGICMLRNFAGRFPGKQAIFNLIQRWPHKAWVSFHRRGWMVFQFSNEDEMELTRQKGPHAIFGIPLILQPMSMDFNPNMDPEINIPVWLRLVDLRATLWNEAAISKIESCIGVTLTTEFQTLHPRIQVIVNAAKKPRDSLQIRLHTREDYELKIEYEFMPKFCTKC